MTHATPAGAELASQEKPVLLTEPTVVLPADAEIGAKDEVVLLHLIVERDGSVSEATVRESRGEVLDSAAMKAALTLQFSPARLKGNPVRARIAFALSMGRGEGPAVTGAIPAPVPLSAPPQPESSEAEIEVVVTGARVPERKDRSVISTQIVTRKEIQESGATTLADALEAQPGLLLSRTFRGTELWIRGLDPEYTLILTDGERVPGRIGGAIDLSRFPLESVERVEIVRGPSSALYGSDAIGGVVNIITREATRKMEADAEARIATGNAAAASGRISARPTQAVGVTLSGGHQHTPEFRYDNTAVATSGSARSLNSAGTALSFGSTRNSRLRLSADYSRTRLSGVDAGSGGAVFDRTQLQEQSLLALNHHKQLSTLYLQSVLQYAHFRDQYLSDQRGDVALDSYQESIEHLGQLTTTLAHTWSTRHRTTAGYEILAQALASERLVDSGYRARYSLFAEHRWVLGIGKKSREVLTVVPGMRLDLDSQFGDQGSPKMALRYDPIQTVALRAGYGRGFRAPSFQELLLRFENPGVGYTVEGNPSLKAESSHSADVSAQWTPSRQWLLTVAGYYNQLKDMIGTVTLRDGSASGTLFSYGNIERAWTRGTDTMVVWSPAELLSLTLGYTWLETRDEENERPLLGRPKHRVLLRASSKHTPSGLSLFARGALAIERTFAHDPDGDGIESTFFGKPLLQIDVGAAKAFTENFQIFCGVNNLADAGDAYTALLPRQGYAGVRGTY